MSELTKYNKVIGLMEQCQVGENLWVKADEAEQHIAYWKRCVETSNSIRQNDNGTIRKQLDQISELQRTVTYYKTAFETQLDRTDTLAKKYNNMFDKCWVAKTKIANWRSTGIACFLIALAEAIFIGVKLL
jgi:hypothetical protein